MKTKSVFLFILVTLIHTGMFAQEKSKKELKEERKLEKQRQIDSLVTAKTFIFVGRTAFPQGGRSVDLTTRTAYVKFYPDSIKSDMPFFGRSYSGAVAYGGDEGLAFEGKPDDFIVEKGKKGYEITCAVKTNKDTYNLSLSVGSEGNSSLTISCHSRSSMSYNGDISEIEPSK